MLIDINAMPEQCPGIQDIAVVQAVDNPLAVLMEAVMQVFNSFGDVNMIADIPGFIFAA